MVLRPAPPVDVLDGFRLAAAWRGSPTPGLMEIPVPRPRQDAGSVPARSGLGVSVGVGRFLDPGRPGRRELRAGQPAFTMV